MSTRTHDVVRLERHAGLAVLTIDDPPLNLFSGAVLDGLAQRLAELSEAPPRALLIHGAGDLTSGGVDVAMFSGAGAAQFQDASERGLRGIVEPLEALRCPTIAACHGLCLTAAFELALACDLIVASRGTQFGLVEASLGLTPAMGGTQRLAARVGAARAAEAVLLSKLYTAETLLAWGAVSRVVDDGELLASARKLAARLAEGPTVAHGATKQILAAFRVGGVAGADAVTPRHAAELFDTEDLAAGIASFLEHGPGARPLRGPLTARA